MLAGLTLRCTSPSGRPSSSVSACTWASASATCSASHSASGSGSGRRASQGRQVGAVDVVHDHEVGAVVEPEVVHVDQPRVAEARADLGLGDQQLLDLRPARGAPAAAP